MKKVLPWTGLVIGVGVLASHAGAAPCTGMRSARQLDRQTAARAAGCLPEPFRELYSAGKFSHAITAPPATMPLHDIAAGTSTDGAPGIYRHDDEFLRASAQNVGRFRLDANGTIVEKQPSDRPTRGFPFPVLDARDPQGGVQVVWNHVYGIDALGPLRVRFSVTRVTALGPGFVQPDQQLVGPGHWTVGGLDIQLAAGATYRVGLFRSGVLELLVRPPAPIQESGSARGRQMLLVQREPADAAVAALRNQYEDPAKLDDYWMYIPALRRVRRLSVAQEGDAFQGTGASIDSLLGFGGKVELFDFQLLEESEQLVPFDRDALRGRTAWRDTAPGVRELILPRVPTIRYFEPGRTGTAWEPLNVELAVRPVWVVEARPKFPQYPFAKLVLVFDRDVFTCPYVLRYLRRPAGEPVLYDGIWTPIGYSRLPDGRPIPFGSAATPKLWINFAEDSALVASLSHPTSLVELGRTPDASGYTVPTMIGALR